MIETDADRGAQHSAWRKPALPPEVLSTRLPDDHSAEAAAQNPSIPMTVMHRMIDLSVIRGRKGRPNHTDGGRIEPAR
ncbi:hypothetical protein ACFVZJ_19195 [Streptomyces sp. NPDC058322]|uniref:hypothetical protein n=1 Tax=unclassified Streptomyces TaxID=2593676 RepID=UPI0036E432DE